MIAGWGSRFDVRAVPMVVFTDPQIAWCGLMEEDLAAENEPFGIERICWSAAGLVQSGPGHEGFTKILYEPDTHLVLGVGIVGSNAAELIGEAALAIEMGAVTTDLASTIHAHPTRSEHLSAAARKAETSAGAGAAPDDAPGPGPSASPGTG